VYFCHGLHWSGDAGLRSWPARTIEGGLLRRTAGVVTLNGEDEEWFRSRRASPLLRLPAGVGLDLGSWPHSMPPERSDGLRLAWVGEMSERKRPGDAVAAVRRLAARGLDVSLTMLGDGPLLDAVRAGAADLTGVRAIGRSDPRPVLADAHALLHTAAWEGLPRVALEAAATGRPAFGYDVKGLRDAPGAAVRGTAGDVEALADLVEGWWRGGIATPDVDRDSLDWRRAHAEVTTLLAQVVSSARS
jgi:glycosyltransferase involved in cell wall biosynthesis